MGKYNETNEYIEVLLMRTQQQINKIKQGQSNPFSVKDVPIQGLLDYYFENEHDVLQKSTGPRVLKVDPMHDIFYPLLSKLQNTIDPCKVRYMHYFDVTDPHILHNDDEFEYPNCYKAFTIPLKIYGDSDDINLVILISITMEDLQNLLMEKILAIGIFTTIHFCQVTDM